VIYLRVFQGLCVADAARELSLSVPAVKARYHRAIRQLTKNIVRKTRPTLISRRHRNLGAVAIRRLNCPAV